MIWIKALEEFQKCSICSFKKTFQELKCSRFFYVACTNIWSLLNHQQEMIFNDKDMYTWNARTGFLCFLGLEFKFGHLNLWSNFGSVLILKYTLIFCILCLFLLPSKQATYYKCSMRPRPVYRKRVQINFGRAASKAWYNSNTLFIGLIPHNIQTAILNGIYCFLPN